MAGRDLSQLPPEHNGTRLLKMLQIRHPEYHPAVSIAAIAHTTDNEELGFRCHATLLKYVEPELRSVQIQADIVETRTIRVSLFEALEDDHTSEKRKLTESLSKAPKLPEPIDAEFVREGNAV